MEHIHNIINKYGTTAEKVLGFEEEPNESNFGSITGDINIANNDVTATIDQCRNMIPCIDINLDGSDKDDIESELNDIELQLEELEDCLDNIKYDVVDCERVLDEKFSEAVEWGNSWKRLALELLEEKGIEIDEYLDTPYAEKVKRYRISKFFLDKNKNV